MDSKGSLPKTDPARWRLRTNSIGVHFWHYLSEEEAEDEQPQSYCEKYLLGRPRVPDHVVHFIPFIKC